MTAWNAKPSPRSSPHDAFLLKSAAPEELVRAIRVVASGEALLDPAVTRRVIEAFSHTRAAPIPSREFGP